ncbi:MAG: hypothetical protein M5U25_04260 [Planctomycetota bacterium]|nr:hypothetical protein [Planctomycetota bacterium]
MNDELDLRIFERNHAGVPYGYGRVPRPVRPPGESLNAVSRPQPIRTQDRDPGGHGLRKLWGRLNEWFDELPNLGRSLLGILATPVRVLRWFGRNPGGILAVVVVGMLLLLLIPISGHGGSRDARRAEGEQLMGSARDFCRVQHNKGKSFEEVHAALEQEVATSAFAGKYYGVEARIVRLDAGTARIYVYPTNRGDGFGSIDFKWDTGESTIRWEQTEQQR